MIVAHLLIALLLALPTSRPVADAPPSHPRTADIPSITSLSPVSAIVGTAGVRLTVTGTNFSRQSTVRWRGIDRPTTFVSGEQLQADIPGADLTTLGAAAVTVFNGGGHGGASNTSNFTVGNPLPILTAVSPSSALAGGEPFSLIVTGSNFVAGTVVHWKGNARQTIFNGPGQVAVAISASDLAGDDNVAISAVNPGPLGGSSATLFLPIVVPVPAISSLGPASWSIGRTEDFLVQLTGQRFIRSAVVRVNGQRRATTWRSPTQLDVMMLASDADTVGSASVTVVQIGGLSRESAPASLELVYPAPRITGKSRSALHQNEPSIPFYIEGQGFIRDQTKVKLNGRPVSFHVVSYWKMEANLQAHISDTAGVATLTVENPTPGGGTASTSIAIKYEHPTILSLAPASVVEGGGAFTLTVRGKRFRPTSIVKWKHEARSTTFVSAEELRASIPASDIVNDGVFDVYVSDTASGTSFYPRSLTVARVVTSVPLPSPPAQPSSTLPGTISIPSKAVPGTALPPALASIAPQNVFRGGPAFTLTVRGERFTPGTKVYWKGAERPTTYVSATELRATIAAGDIAAVGSAEIRVGLAASALSGSARLGILDAMVRISRQ